MYMNPTYIPTKTPWNKGKLVGQKRPYDLMQLRVADTAQAGNVQSRTRVIQMKIGRPVQFEISEQIEI